MSPKNTLTSAGAYSEGAYAPKVDQRGDGPVTIRLTDQERISGVTRLETVQQCLYHYHRDGFVVLENAIDDDTVDALYKKIVEDTRVYVGKKFQQWNQGEATRNVSVVPPLTPEWLRREFYANVHTMRVIENILGPKPELRFINSNVAMPGATGRQAVHSDVNHDFPTIPFGIVVNTYLQDSDEQNGVTEVWAGTHNAYGRDEQQSSKESGWIRKEYIQKQAKIKAPLQPRLKKGSICLRDLRLWHAGMPNRSERHRIMLAIDYLAAWYQCPMRLTLPVAARAEIENWGVSTAGVDWAEGEVDYLNQPFYLNMTQDPGMYIKQTEKGVEDWRARATGVYEFDKAIATEQNWWTPEA